MIGKSPYFKNCEMQLKEHLETNEVTVTSENIRELRFRPQNPSYHIQRKQPRNRKKQMVDIGSNNSKEITENRCTENNNIGFQQHYST